MNLSNRTVVVVGNGSSLLGSNLGKTIDSYDEIVRFNNFQIEPYSIDVGSKTSVWICNRRISGELSQTLQTHSFKEIYVHTWTKTSEAAQTIRDEVQGHGLATPVHEIGKHELKEMGKFLGTSYFTFSTGAIGVWLMTKRFRVVTMVGFDWWNNPAKIHYFNDNQQAPNSVSGHQPALEKLFFDRLEELGAVVMV